MRKEINELKKKIWNRHIKKDQSEREKVDITGEPKEYSTLVSPEAQGFDRKNLPRELPPIVHSPDKSIFKIESEIPSDSEEREWN